MSSTAISQTPPAVITTVASWMAISKYDTGAVGKSADFDGQTQVTFGHVPAFERDAPFAISWWMHANQKLGMPVMQQIADATSRRGIEIALDDFADHSTAQPTKTRQAKKNSMATFE